MLMLNYVTNAQTVQPVVLRFVGAAAVDERARWRGAGRVASRSYADCSAAGDPSQSGAGHRHSQGSSSSGSSTTCCTNSHRGCGWHLLRLAWPLLLALLALAKSVLMTKWALLLRLVHRLPRAPPSRLMVLAHSALPICNRCCDLAQLCWREIPL